MAARFRYICAHEAAHAVVGHHLGIQILKVVIPATRTPEGYSGYCLYQPIGRRQKLALGIMLAAGQVSDRIHRAGRSLDDGDRQLALGAGFRDEDFDWLESCARALLIGPLKRSWQDVSAALRERDLTAREVRSFCGKPLLR